MPFLVTVGATFDDAMDQARTIMGDGAAIVATGHQENVDYFQFNKEAPVTAPINSFQAGIAGSRVAVVWVLYS